MNLDLRHAIISNISTNDRSQLEDTIVDAIQNGEEKMLPGLGVLFELIWQESDATMKKNMVETLETSVQQSSQADT
jgi:small acid-soluble spore protein I (minor)